MAMRKRPIATGIATLLFSGYLSALGLGEIKLNSALNEPLDAEIPLLNMGDLAESDIIAGLASNQDFANAGVAKELILTTLRFELDMDAPAGPTLRVQSRKPIREPYLDFLVDVQWPAGRLLREYTLLLDLPVYVGGGAIKKNIDRPLSGGARASRVAANTAPQVDTNQPDIVASDREYVVRDGDTLWRIASNLPADVSVQRRMGAIQQLNPDAFINGNINLLKRGAVLRLPDYGNADGFVPPTSVAADSPGTAPRLNGSSRGAGADTADYNSGRLSLEASDGRAGSSAVGGGAGGLSGVRGELVVVQEELDRSRRENSELKQRLLNLEDQIATMQQLMEISDDDLRAVQLAAQAGRESPDLAAEGGSVTSGQLMTDAGERDSPALALFPSANTSPPRKAPAAGAPSSPAPAAGAAAGAGGEGASPASAAPTTDKTAGAAAEVQPAEPARAPAKMALNTEKGWLDKVNGFLAVLAGLVVVLIGAIVFFVLRRRRDDAAGAEPAQEIYTPPPMPARERTREVAAEPQASSIDDIDLKEEDDLFAPPASEPAAAVASAPAEPPPSADAPESLEDMELDLSEFDLDDNSADVEFDDTDRSTPATGGDELNLDEEFDFLGNVDEGDTQLELAQAYIEMGDQAGAREILQEVSENGSDAQKTRASQLLQELA